MSKEIFLQIDAVYSRMKMANLLADFHIHGIAVITSNTAAFPAIQTMVVSDNK